MKRELQVFISSTYSDLREERQAAVEAILKAGHIPAGMELFTAGDKSQVAAIERWIDESDVFMLILGGRYGSIEPTTGLSYVELEYDYAVAHEKPTFAVVICDDAIEEKVKSGGTAFIEKENPKALVLFRQKVLKNISSFFNDTKDIKLCVYESMSDYTTNPDLKGWIAAEEVQEPKALQEEINKLRDENRSLIERVGRLQATANVHASTQNTVEDDELLKVLQAIEVKIPRDVTGGKEATMDLFSIVYGNRDTLINGVTNAMNASHAEMFLYFNIIPKLQAYELADNEKVPSARYRRGFLNRKGQAFFAGVEKKILLARADATSGNKVKATDNNPPPPNETKEEPQTTLSDAPASAGPNKTRKRSKKRTSGQQA
jgi:Domain of unknown function (DUF4062)